MNNVHQAEAQRKAAEAALQEFYAAVGAAIDAAGGLGDPVPPVDPEHDRRVAEASQRLHEHAVEFYVAVDRGEVAVDSFGPWVTRRAQQQTMDAMARCARTPRAATRRCPAPVRRESGRRPARVVTSGAAAVPAGDDSGGDAPPEPPRHAVLCNQRTAPELFGWSPRRFIAFVRGRGIRHAWDGRLCVCRVADVLAALGLSDAPAPAPPTPAWSPDDVVAELRSGGRGRR